MSCIGARVVVGFVDPWDLVTEVGSGGHFATVVSASARDVHVVLERAIGVGGATIEALRLSPRHVGVDLTANAGETVLANAWLLPRADAAAHGMAIVGYRRVDAGNTLGNE